MSVAEVRKLFPVVQPIEEPDPTRAGWVALLRADKAPIDGLRQTVTFTFKNGELISVVTSAGGRPDPTALNPQEVQQILATLQSKYGQPVRCKGPDNNMLLACFWRGNGVFVGYMGRTDPLPMALTFFHAWEEQDGALLQ
jgi:hypothetical protein